MRKLPLIAFLLSLSLSAFSVTPNQRKIMKAAAREVMISFGAELESSPAVTSLTIVKEDKNLAYVEFSGVEFGPYEYSCSFVFDLKNNKTVVGSEKCK